MAFKATYWGPKHVASVVVTDMQSARLERLPKYRESIHKIANKGSFFAGWQASLVRSAVTEYWRGASLVLVPQAVHKALRNLSGGESHASHALLQPLINTSITTMVDVAISSPFNWWITYSVQNMQHKPKMGDIFAASQVSRLMPLGILYRGMSANLLSYGGGWLSYYLIKAWAEEISERVAGKVTYQSLAAATVPLTLVASAVTAPLDMLYPRLQGEKKSIAEVVRKVVASPQGVRGLYVGFWANFLVRALQQVGKSSIVHYFENMDRGLEYALEHPTPQPVNTVGEVASAQAVARDCEAP